MKPTFFVIFLLMVTTISGVQAKPQNDSSTNFLSDFARVVSASGRNRQEITNGFEKLIKVSTTWDADSLLELFFMGFAASKKVGLDGCEDAVISSENLVDLLRRAFAKSPQIVRKKLSLPRSSMALTFIKDRYSLNALLGKTVSELKSTKWNYADGLYQWRLYFDLDKVTYYAPNNEGLSEPKDIESLTVSGKYEMKKDGSIILLFDRNTRHVQRRQFTGKIRIRGAYDHQLAIDGLGVFNEGPFDACPS